MVSPLDGEPSMICPKHDPISIPSVCNALYRPVGKCPSCGNTHLEAHQRLTLVVLVWRRPGGLPPDDAKLHVFDLQPDQQEVDPPDYDVLQVVLALGVFELDVQAVLNTDVHLDAAVHLGRDAVRVHPDVLLPDDICHAAADGDADEVAQLDIDAVIGLVLLLDILEVEVVSLGVLELAGRGELLDQGEEFVVVSAVEEHLYSAGKSAGGNWGWETKPENARMPVKRRAAHLSCR